LFTDHTIAIVVRAATDTIPDNGTEGVGGIWVVFTVTELGDGRMVVVSGAMLVCDTAGRAPNSTEEIVK